MKREDFQRDAWCLWRRRRPLTVSGRIAIVLAAAALHVLLVATAHADPTQEDVFRSISQNVNENADAGKFLAVIAGAVAIVLLLAFLHQRKSRVASPRAVQHTGKLIKEVMRSISLRPAELKQLRLLAEQSQDADGAQRVQNPLTLILCPSVLVKAMRNPPAKVDRKVIAQIARKLGAHQVTQAKGRAVQKSAA